MKSKRLLLISVCSVLILVALSLGAACAKPAPAPVPAPAPAPRPTPAPAPAPHPRVDIEILANPTGTTGYVLCFAIADIINKYHPWLRASSQATSGSVENVKILIEKPEKRATTLGFIGNLHQFGAKLGMPPYKEKRAFKVVAQTFVALTGMATLDPKIKTPKDLIGKKMVTMEKGQPIVVAWEILMKDVWGISDKVHITYAHFDAAKTALLDGTAHLGMVGYSGGMVTPSLEELITARPTYFYHLTPEDVKAVSKILNWDMRVGTIPAGAHRALKEEYQGFVISTGLYADPEMGEEIPYEICKILYEHYAEFGAYHASAKAWTQEFFAKAPHAQEDFHPGTLKFCKEKGIKVGAD